MASQPPSATSSDNSTIFEDTLNGIHNRFQTVVREQWALDNPHKVPRDRGDNQATVCHSGQRFGDRPQGCHELAHLAQHDHDILANNRLTFRMPTGQDMRVNSHVTILNSQITMHVATDN
eukprot:3789771-Amphidinium_carterae.1